MSSEDGILGRAKATAVHLGHSNSIVEAKPSNKGLPARPASATEDRNG